MVDQVLSFHKPCYVILLWMSLTIVAVVTTPLPESYIQHSGESSIQSLTQEGLENDDLGSAIEVEPDDEVEIFARQGINRTFTCTVSKAKFSDRFDWYFKWKNGSYTRISRKSSTSLTIHGDKYVNSIPLQFPSTEVISVVCVAFLSKSDSSYNSSYAVDVMNPISVKIDRELSKIPNKMFHSGMNLTCATYGRPRPTFSWFKDGEPVDENLPIQYYSGADTSVPSKSILFLDPKIADNKTITYTCVVQNSLERDAYNWTINVPKSQQSRNETSILTLITGSCIFLVAILIVVLTFFKLTPRRFSASKIDAFFHGQNTGGNGFQKHSYRHLQDQQSYQTIPYEESKEIDMKALIKDRKLKDGNFGKVELGRYTTEKGSTTVAIKSIKDNYLSSQAALDFAFQNFLDEIKIMQLVGEHKNVVHYVGAVTSDLAKYSALLVTEYCCEGDLATYLRDIQIHGGAFQDDIEGRHSNLATTKSGKMAGKVLKTSHLLKWAHDIAYGMDYIASKNLVHRDLAARNVLLSCNGYKDCEYHHDPEMLTAKISDFGMSKNLDDYPREYYRIIVDNGPRPYLHLPLRWFSVEALKSLKFTTQSDVWAYGVTLWEMFSLGGYPYGSELPDHEHADLRQALLDHFKEDFILVEPQFVPQNVWELMQLCWKTNQTERPSFKDLHSSLTTILNLTKCNNKKDGIQDEMTLTPLYGYHWVPSLEPLVSDLVCSNGKLSGGNTEDVEIGELDYHCLALV